MLERVVARRYARAFYAVAYAENRVGEVLGALGDFGRVFAERSDLRELLLHPAVPLAAKESLVSRFAADAGAREFLRLLMVKGRLELAPMVADEFARLYRRDAGILAAEVTTATPLPDEVAADIKRVVEVLSGKRVELTSRVDETVVGGVRLTLGDHVIDGTLAARLGEIKAAMAGAGGLSRAAGSKL
jgi:F-type H+-transporting ATPase subunit delta